jgi:hypothetical protein
MRLDEDGRTVSAMDILVPKIGEIIGGSQVRAPPSPAPSPALPRLPSETQPGSA